MLSYAQKYLVIYIYVTDFLEPIEEKHYVYLERKKNAITLRFY
jgi:hypothetical protein